MGGNLEVVPYGGIDISVILELSEECVVVVTEKDVRPGFEREIVGGFIVDDGAYVGVFIGGREVCEKREGEVLVHEEFREPKC